MSRIDVERDIEADPASVALLLADPTLPELGSAAPLQRTPTAYVGRVGLERCSAVVSLEYATTPAGRTVTRARVRVEDAAEEQARAFLGRLAALARERLAAA